MPMLYGAIFLLALAVVVFCLVMDRGRSKCLLLLTLSVAVCNLGQYLLSTARALEGALWANRMAYLGQVFLPMLILLMVMQLCGARYPRWLPAALTAVSLGVLVLVMSPGVTTWYYDSVDIVVTEGATQLIRTYGAWHRAYHVYLLGYLLGGILVVIHARGKDTFYAVEHTWLLMAAVLGNLMVWIIEAFLPRGFEFLTISYVITEFFILVAYHMLQELTELRGAAREEPPEGARLGEMVTVFTDAHIDRLFANHPCLSGFSQREQEILRHLLADRPRKEIAETMYLSESSIKKYTAAVFRKLEVKDRKELFSQMADYL